jgi:3-oxoacyl-(acyl-carrier-protein) synthase
MKQQPLYVHAACSISPQHSFLSRPLLSPLVGSGTGKLFALEADYSRYISPVAIRRMSRIMKMTISAAMECLAQAGVATPDAIITGTGRGGVTDMEQVVKDLRRFNEASLNPTAFIQSTYNSPNGWIAMQSGCTCYNQTYVHRGCSFELALMDAQMLLREGGSSQRILAGCYDELTEEYFLIRAKRGYWKQNPPDSSSLLRHSDTPGTIAGEGSSFFVLSGDAEGAIGKIEAVKVLHHASAGSIAQAADDLLEGAGVTAKDVSLLLFGLNGDKQQSELYDSLFDDTPPSLPIAGFKPLCGEYDTASGFGLWLALQLGSGCELPADLMLRGHFSPLETTWKVLLVNHFVQGAASLLLLEMGSCAR